MKKVCIIRSCDFTYPMGIRSVFGKLFPFTTRICGKATSLRFDVSSMVGARSFAKSLLLEHQAIGDRSDPKTGKAYQYLVTI
ncbi:MAG: hypothetical protein WA364_16780 [Candidatus Nitrosopolaris sp.]